MTSIWIPNSDRDDLELHIDAVARAAYIWARFWSALGGAVLERWFKLAENKTGVRQELLGGVTTFMTMSYIIVVNPRILAEAGMPIEGVLFATCISAAVATLVMGLWANYPIALAPGMSLNAYFTYSIVLGRGVPWQTALGVVFDHLIVQDDDPDQRI